MARYILASQSVTLGAYADSTSLATNSNYPFFLQGGSATMQLKINEIQCGGESTASATSIMVLRRDSVVAVTPSGCVNSLADATATAPATTPIFGNSATTKPSTGTAHLLQQSFNAYGGLVRWQARQGEEITIYGQGTSVGEVSYSGFTGASGIVSTHCIYEVV